MTITMQEWIFDESYGRYAIDLGDSNVDACAVGDLPGLDRLAAVPLGYGHEAGLPELRAAIARDHPGAGPDHVLVTHGAQEAFSLVMRVVAQGGPGEVIVVASGWAQHAEFPAELGLDVLALPAGGDDADLLASVAAAATWRTRAIVVASPDNPTGWVASRDLLDALAEIADAYDALLVVDEEYVIGAAGSVACRSDAVVVIGGLSKTHGLPGLRVGWCIGAPDLIRSCVRRKHLTTISNSLVCEMLAVAVLEENDRFLQRARDLCTAGAACLRDWAARTGVEVLAAADDLPFAWLRLAEGLDSLAVARAALVRGVMVVPGEVFGRPGHLRVAVGRALPELRSGLAAVAEALSEHGAAAGRPDGVPGAPVR